MSIPMRVNHAACVDCGLCLRDCPKEAIARAEGGKPVIGEGCVACQVCAKTCPKGAIAPSGEAESGVLVCSHCPVHCHIARGQTGACHRYENNGGPEPHRTVPLEVYSLEAQSINPFTGLPYRPLLTAVGAGSNLQMAPARVIASASVEGVDVVTAVTEAVLSFSGIEVKIDTSDYIGDEGAPVRRDGVVVGHVGTSYYAARTLNICGVTLLKSASGFTAARTLVDLTSGREVELQIEGGSQLRIALGQVPIINGVPVATTTFGCGSSVGKGFSPILIPIVDECIMLDMGITGQMSEHHAAIGAKPCGITVIGKRSSPGRYLVPSGKGWGGTCVENPLDAIAAIDKTKAFPGLRLLIMDTKVEHAAYFELDESYVPQPLPFPPGVAEALEYMKGFCDPGTVNIMYVGGIGGGVRSALNSEHSPLICQSIKNGSVQLTAAGQPVYVYPGGNLIFSVDVAKMPRHAICWEPTPATSVPIEFTMTRATYHAISDYHDAIVPYEEVLSTHEHVVIE